MKTTKDVFNNSTSPKEFVDGYLEHLFDLIKLVDTKQIADFIEQLITTRDAGGTTFFIGNGGSAATASHFANDIGIGTRAWSKPFKILSLCDNNAVMTAIGNDFGYEELFKRQLQTLLKPNDFVVAISASGNSENLIRAINYCKSIGAKTLGLTGFSGGELKELSDMNIHIPSENGEYGPVEDFHMIVDHIVGNFLMNKFREEG
jgi:D-sedoheptulose 7-phosphate isomerase